MIEKNRRPRFLDLRKIRLPITGVVSIGHRLSGILMVLTIPFALYLLDISLRGSVGFAQATAIVHHPLVTVFGLLLAWGFGHHLFAGLRVLLLDMDICVKRAAARRSAAIALAGGVFILLLMIGLQF